MAKGGKIKNWSRASTKLKWKNDKNGKKLAVKEDRATLMNENIAWELKLPRGYDNHYYSTKKIAKRKAAEWMRKHPNP